MSDALARKPPSLEHAPAFQRGLVGRCFVIWGEETWKHQGIVVSWLTNTHYLCQYFDEVSGTRSTLFVATIDRMAETAHRALGCFEFFMDEKDLRDWIDRHPRRSDTPASKRAKSPPPSDSTTERSPKGRHV